MVSALALQEKVKLWQENFVAPDLAAGTPSPAALLDTIDGGDAARSGTLARRAGTGDINRTMELRRLAFTRSLVKPDYRAGYRR
ncbi:MAG: hypothetical protein WBF43_08295 [Methylocella sp.]